VDIYDFRKDRRNYFYPFLLSLVYNNNMILQSIRIIIMQCLPFSSDPGERRKDTRGIKVMCIMYAGKSVKGKVS
jgi:hypothetical protein